MILIVSQEDEPNVDAVERVLEQRRAEYLRFNTEAFPLSSSLVLRDPGQQPTGHLCVAGRRIALDQISTVWYRRRGPFRLVGGLSESEHTFIDRECLAALNGLWSILPCFWVNDPMRQRDAANKVLQLKIARDVGLQTPRTLITNDPDEVLRFYERCGGRVIFKITSGQAIFTAQERREPQEPGLNLLNGGAIYTNLLNQDDLGKLESVRYAPVLFQEYVPKQYELRITIVGRRLFSAAIYSQDAPSEQTRIDWRRYDLAHTPHRRHELRPEIAHGLCELMERSGLAFGCVDMIVTPDDRYVFLENNPSGQYQWIEHLVGFPITETLADMLIRGRIAEL